MSTDFQPLPWSEEVRDHDSTLRSKFIESHIDLVRYLALRISNRLPAGIDVDDLVHDGILGLMDAADRFDPERGVRFRTYAETRIRGAILDGLRQKDWRPRSVRNRKRNLDAVLSELATTLNRSPSENEIAERLGLQIEEYRSMLVDVKSGPLLSLEDLPARVDPLVTSDSQLPDRALERNEMISAMSDEIAGLPPRERRVLELYYVESLNMKEVGAVLGVTESRVCQLHSQAAGRLRSALNARLHFTAEVGEELMAEEPLLSQEEVSSVLSTDDDPHKNADEGSTVYSLRRPVAIAPEAETTARERLEKMAEALRGCLERELGSEVGLEVQGFQQEQVAAALETLPRPCWLLSFIHGDGGGLTLGLDPACALSLVELALGGAGNSSADGRDPTPLETRVLTNLCRSLAPAVARKSGVDFSTGTFSSVRLPSEVAAPGQTVGIALLKLNIAETDRSGLILSTPNLLQEPGDAADDPELGPLAAPLERVPLEVRAVLKAGLISLSDLRSLEPGTILRFSIAQDTSLDLRVAGQTIFRGNIHESESGAEFHIGWRRGRHKEES